MALSSDIVTSFLVLSLTFSLLCPYSVSQSTQLSASGAGSGEGRESGQIYVVAPTMEDCTNDTYEYCESLPYYAREYTNELSNVVFWFLPGTHNLSRDWIMNNSKNITLLGGKDLPNSGKLLEGPTNIVCQELRSGGIHVRNSNFTVVENVTIAKCIQALVFHATVNATVAMLLSRTTM